MMFLRGSGSSSITRIVELMSQINPYRSAPTKFGLCSAVGILPDAIDASAKPMPS
jgi:hypothetical protein